MLVMAAALIAGCIGGLVAGGSLSRLASTRIRAWPILVGAAVIEACLGATPGPLRTVLAVTACLAVVGWCAANRGTGTALPLRAGPDQRRGGPQRGRYGPERGHAGLAASLWPPPASPRR